MQLARPAEARSSGDLGERQIGVVDQAAGEVRPARSGDGCGSRADMVLEQSPQLTGAVADVGRQCLFVVVIEKAVVDAQQCRSDRRGHIQISQ